MSIMSLQPRVSRLTLAFEWLVVAAALLVPPFFLPLTPDPLEFNKFFLLFFLTVAMGVLWCARLVVSRTVSATEHPALRLLAVFLGVAVIAWAFSPVRYVGLVGQPGFYNHSLAQLLTLGLFAFFVSQLRREIFPRMLRAFALGGALVVVYNLFKLYGLELLPFAETKSAAFNLITSSTGILALFVSVLVSLSLGLSFVESSRGWRAVFWAVGILGAALLIILDHLLGWVGIITGLAVLLVSQLIHPTTRAYRRVALLAVFLAVSVVLLPAPVGRLSRVSPRPDVVLARQSSGAIVGQVLRRDPVFGTGPESFAFDFVHYRTREYNQTSLWDLRFFKANSEFHQLLSSYGFVGVLTFFALLLFLTAQVAHRLIRQRADDARWLAALGSSWLAVVVSGFFYPFSFMTTFLLFFLIGTLLGAERQARGEPSVGLGGGQQRLALLGFALAIVVGLAAVFFGGRLWFGELLYARASRAINRTEDLAKIEPLLRQAISLNNRESRYAFTLAQTKLVQAKIELTKQQPDQSFLQQAVSQSAEATTLAVAANPKSPETYEQLADLYAFAQDVTGVDFSGAILAAFTEAARVEPKNPLHFLRSGQVELRLAIGLESQLNQLKEEEKQAVQSQRDESLTRADVYFTHAENLKPAYPPVQIGKALVLERRGKIDEAVALLLAATTATPADVDTWFQLGRLLRGQGKKDVAVAAFQQVVALEADNANAFYNLAQLYEEQGKNEEALKAYEQVDALSPGSDVIKQKLESLRGGS